MKMWPMFVDYSDEDCKRVLRSLELEAYSSIINAFRAQGNLTKDRRKMLQELCGALSISMERHRAEIRRAVNDEHLNTIAERLFGPNTATEWAIEGRRVVPLMQRLAPQTVFTEIANSVASAQAAKNASLLHPGKTGLREVSNGVETMASRKRKDFVPDYSSMSPQKIPAMDNQFLNNMFSLENACSIISDSSQVPEMSMNCDNFILPETAPQVSSFADFSAPRSTTTLTTAIPISSPVKSISKHPILKPTSTVTTFSSFDQMTSNLLTSKCASQNPTSSVGHEEQPSTVSEPIKLTSDLKTVQRSLGSVSSIKSSTIVIPTPVSTSTSSSNKERLPTPPSTTSQNNKFLTQIRSKNPSQARQNLPAGLGIKLSPQTQMSPRATVSPKSPSMKMKHESTSFFPKKTSSTVYPSSSVSDNQTSQYPLTSSSDSLSITKSPISITKTNAKTESQTILHHQSSAKQTTVTKSIPKTSAQGSQYISRSLFSTASKSGAKNLPPVIFNVSSTSCTPLQTSTKTTGTISSEAGKSSPQLIPKTAAVGISSSHLKINTSNTQTIQYRNDGGLVRSARIVNISQPVGSRLPCAISPSAISALGLSTNLSSTALRVTLPAGTLNTTSSIRVSAAAKPNVIVVHKAQMWPRAQQGAAVIMGSAPLSKLPNDVQESVSQKHEKSKPVISKPTSRSVASTRPQSPAVSASSVRVTETTPVSNLVSNAIPNASQQPDSSTSESQNSKLVENTNEVQCKKNLLADIIEASGILLDRNSPEKSSSKEKTDSMKHTKELSNHQEKGPKISQKSTVSSSTSEANLVNFPESNTSKATPVPHAEEASIASAELALVSVSQSERNGVTASKSATSQAQISEAPTKESNNAVVSSTHTLGENVTSSSECGSKVQKEIAKEKDL